MPHGESDSLTLKEAFRKAGCSGKTALTLSTWFGSGLLPLAPGTFGTIAAIPPAVLFAYLGVVYTVLFLIFIVPVALWASERSRNLLGRDDPPEVVIDEVTGFLLAIFLLPLSWVSLISGFLLFRIFDVWKPFPIGTIDRKLRSGIGIVLDDVLAGVYANICVRVLLVCISL